MLVCLKNANCLINSVNGSYPTQAEVIIDMAGLCPIIQDGKPFIKVIEANGTFWITDDSEWVNSYSMMLSSFVDRYCNASIGRLPGLFVHYSDYSLFDMDVSSLQNNPDVDSITQLKTWYMNSTREQRDFNGPSVTAGAFDEFEYALGVRKYRVNDKGAVEYEFYEYAGFNDRQKVLGYLYDLYKNHPFDARKDVESRRSGHWDKKDNVFTISFVNNATSSGSVVDVKFLKEHDPEVTADEFEAYIQQRENEDLSLTTVAGIPVTVYSTYAYKNKHLKDKIREFHANIYHISITEEDASRLGIAYGKESGPYIEYLQRADGTCRLRAEAAHDGASALIIPVGSKESWLKWDKDGIVALARDLVTKCGLRFDETCMDLNSTDSDE